MHAAPSVDANALRSRHALIAAMLRTIRSSPPCSRIAASAANRRSSFSSSGTSNGSIVCGEAQWPVAGGTGASEVGGPAGWASAIASASASAASAPAALTSRVAAKPHPPPTRTRTPIPSDTPAAKSSTWPERMVSASSRRSTWRASA